ncbi:hypothetical protein [Streptomyces sp. LaPpAH-108]|uniref:hypothetical protein n=1 Tax=Streptomyces sp. LaPpAH-108 TaxID=1155714 RepID=UPI00036ED705|nr:hypothetical protein [Streptomyces sp. LaPpAH-108]
MSGTTAAYPSLVHALAEVIVDLTWFIDGADDERMDQDDAVKALDGVAAVLDRLSAGQRGELLAVIEGMAAAETDPRRRAFLRDFPEDLGLEGPEPADDRGAPRA